MEDETRALTFVWESWLGLFHGLPYSHYLAAAAALIVLIFIGALIRAVMGQQEDA